MVYYPTRHHPSEYHDQRVVYPVISRRSGGVSIGMNISPTKLCNFGCLYCQVQLDRMKSASDSTVRSPLIDLARLDSELRSTVALVQSGALFSEPRFAAAAPERRRLKDFAFSGDGEPTLSPQFPEAVAVAAQVRKDFSLDALQLVLITNATTLQNEKTIAGCDLLAENNGRIWAKLDGGTAEAYRAMNRSKVSYDTILSNLAFALTRWQVALQTMILRCDGNPPTQAWVDDYCDQVNAICKGGKPFTAIQLYTVARLPFDHCCAPLSDDEMNRYAEQIRSATGQKVEVYYSR